MPSAKQSVPKQRAGEMPLSDKKTHKVYISSTYEDLKSLRQAARDVIITKELLPIGMEHYTTSGQRPVDKCLADVRRCDIYLGLVAFRYGFEPPGFDGKSITQLEYEEAGKAGIPRLIFVISENANWPAKWIDKDRDKIDKFRNHLLAEHTSRPLDDPHAELKFSVAAAIDDTVRALDAGRRPAPARHAATSQQPVFEFPALLPYLSDRRKQRDELKALLSDACKKTLHCKPLVCLVHGHEHECHGEFLDKVCGDILPDLLNLRKRHNSIGWARITWPAPVGSPAERLELYRRTLAQQVAGLDTTRTERIVEGLNRYRHPVLIHSETMTSDWSRDEETLIEHWLDFWNTLPDLVDGRQLFVMLCIKHSAVAVPSLRQRLFGTPQERARKFVSQLDFSRRTGIQGRVLSELTAVPYDDLHDWIEDFVNDYLKNNDQRIWLKRDLRERIQQLYAQQRSQPLPMNLLARQLTAILDEFKAHYPFGA